MKKPEPAIKDYVFEDVGSEEECYSLCESKFCHGMIYVPEKKLCRCLLCTGFLKEEG